MRKIDIGNDQAKWRKTLGKALRKSELSKAELKNVVQKKKQSKDHPKRMIWHNKESKIPAIMIVSPLWSIAHCI